MVSRLIINFNKSDKLMPDISRDELMNANTQITYQLVIRYVAEKHLNQKLEGTKLPYLVHLCNVAMEIMMAAPYSDPFDLKFAVQVALLHDVVEDGHAKKKDISRIFGDDVSGAVNALTKNEALPKEQRMLDSLKRIKKERHEVWAVKMADRITNLQPPPAEWSMEKRNDYVTEANLIYEHLRAGNLFLANRLKMMIEEYKGYNRNILIQDPADE